MSIGTGFVPVPPGVPRVLAGGPIGSTLIDPRMESGRAGGIADAVVPTSRGGLLGLSVLSMKSVRIDCVGLSAVSAGREMVFLIGAGAAASGGGNGTKVISLSSLV